MPAETKRSRKLSTQPAATGRDPLWFKDAVIYQLHVRAFFDANGDGIGDFEGLTAKLDYIQDLDVTAIWLLPFFASPLRDDGYDISDYMQIHASYGTQQDFRAFLREAHRRELRVVTELVLNHTSDQHEWFQRSRRSKPGTKWRDFYVWSDGDDRYREARVIFQDFETSNWTWDPVAESYFWHRFYHHQPDLNFDNPEVHAAMLKVIDFWFDLGVDGVRLDAVPYLYEREGTNCENLPETHAFLRKLRRHVDQRYEDKMLLAEANQWPEDASAYFGDGDECQMNFHFPLMPRLFMAIEREDRFPIIDILEQTPRIPENCQWGIFLRNHDELTLEMVTDEERDSMYRAYADDPRARVNLGIRRRLAPLLRDDRRKIELMNALLLSLPGTPIIYYGDEIRMGDNIYLGDRDGIRTPMQWNEDRNAGFSRVNPQRLYLPVIIDAPYHYASRNVEVEQASPHSMLWWMRRIIRIRKQHSAFGRGSIEFLAPDNPKLLAYLRSDDQETLLVVANLSRSVQCAELDLSRYRGQTPIELFGRSPFPTIGELPYFLTLSPFAFFWFQLKWPNAEAESLDAQLPSCTIRSRWDQLFEGPALARLEAALPTYMKRHHWFAGSPDTIQQVRLLDVLSIQDHPKGTRPLRNTRPAAAGGMAATRLLVVAVDDVTGASQTYLLPVVFARGDQEQNILGDHPSSGIIHVRQSETGEQATLCDGTREEEFWLLLLDAISRRRSIPGRQGEIETYQTRAFSDGPANDPLDAAIQSVSQRHTSAVFGRHYIMKLFRRLAEGENPELEIGRFLTERQPLAHVPRLLGALNYRSRTAGSGTMAVLHEFVVNQGNAWTHAIDEVGRYVERIESESSGPPDPQSLPQHGSLVELVGQSPPEMARQWIGPYLQTASQLGLRTAELHLSLASGETAAFQSEPFSKLYQRSLYQTMQAQAKRTLGRLRAALSKLPVTASAPAQALLSREQELIGRFRRLTEHRIEAGRIRCHGDLHLGQILFTGNDFVFFDFEGDPDRPVSQRRIKISPLSDVACMIRSLHCASQVVTIGPERACLLPSESDHHVTSWLAVWYFWNAAAYLRAYIEAAVGGGLLPSTSRDQETLLNAFLLDRCIAEIDHELDHCPDWLHVPLCGAQQILDGSLERASEPQPET